ncbi:MAG TPA: glycosyltransferase family 9 protein [Thermodesulfovibrionales bacterium]|nr:glycosyltransferase family 9 protein [Thermodesulfovibrionales bacterium]
MPDKYNKILIIKPSSLGDIVHSLPVLDALYRCFPEAEMHWLIAKGLEGLLENHPMLKKVWIIHKDEWKKISRIQTTVAELRALFRDLRKEKFDLVIDLQGLFRSGLIAKATGAPMRIGFKEARERSITFYTHTVEGGRDIHAVDRYLKIPAFLGCKVAQVRFPFSPSVPSPDSSLPVSGEYVVMVPGARKPVNRWPARRFGELASRLPMRTLVLGSRGDRMLAEEVVRVSRGKAESLAGRTDIKGLIQVIRGARFMVSNDTGPMHIAAAFGIPVFALFGPANPMKTGPYGKGHTIIRKNISCAPCYRRTCKNPRCLDMITVGEVAEIISDFLMRNNNT